MIINKEIEKQIIKIAKEKGAVNPFRSNKIKYLVDYLNQRFPMLRDKKYSVGMKIYWLENGINDFPKCSNPKCDNKNITHHCHYPNGYIVTHCCNKCASNDKNTVSQILKTKNDRYGSKGYNNREQCKKTCLKLYGTEYMAQNIDKIIMMQETKKGRKLTESEIDNLVKLNQFKGTDLTYEDKQFFIFLDDVLPNLKNRKEKYTHKEKLSIHSKVNMYNKMTTEWKHFRPMFDVYKFLESDPNVDDLKWKCLDCGNEFYAKFNGHYKENLRCLKCNPYNHGHSKAEGEMQKYINSIVPHDSYYRNTKHVIYPLDLDDYVKDLNVAFEFNGLYVHCDCCKNDKYHLTKTEKCENSGIKLIHIFEDEWNSKKEQCKWFIRKNLNSYDYTIKAEDCCIREIDNKTFKTFINMNHVLPPKNSKWRYGLYYNSDLVYVCSFSKDTSGNGYVVDRFCEKIGYNISGSIKKCIIEFSNNVSNNVSIILDRRFYCKRDISMKMENIKILSPDFYYVNYGYDYRINRRKTSVGFWKKELKTYDDTKSVYDNIKLNKYAKIFNSGYLKIKITP